MNALDGFLVIDLSHVIAGPTATHYLAAQGAEVIKIERPAAGDALRHSGRMVDEGISEAFAAINAGKKSLAVDLHHPRMRDAILQLIAKADVFVENFRPGAIDRLGLGYEQVREVNPNIIYASISGFGQEGAWRERGAYDHVVQGAVGMMMCNGDPGTAPFKVGFPVIDSATGMVAAQAIVAFLLRRARTGQGAHLDISMTQAAVQLMLTQVTRSLARQSDMPRIGNRGFTGSPGAACFECADGWISVAANTPEQFRKLCEVLEIPQLIRDEALISQAEFHAERGFVVALRPADVHARLSSAFRQRVCGEMESHLNRLGVPAAKVRTILEFMQENTRDHLATLPVRETTYPGANIHTFTPGYAIVGEAMDDQLSSKAAPRLGADTGNILQSLDFSMSDLADLEACGVIRQAG